MNINPASGFQSDTSFRDTLSAARKEFPGALSGIYLDVAARGLLSRRVRGAVDRFLDERMEGADKAAMFDVVERVRRSYARLINAEPDEIAFTKNISEGLNIIAHAIPWKAGDNIVVCTELEHPANVYPWLGIQSKYGVRLKTITPRDGTISVGAIAEAIDERTALVTLSSATFAPGFLTEVAAIGRHCRERGIFTVVDGAQSVGIMHTDVAAMNVDALCVSTQKGLLALYGMGMLYCRRAWTERMHPAYLSRFGVDLGDAHEASTGGSDYRLAAGARRFDVGNYNYIACVAVEPSLALLQDIGTPAIEAHVRALTLSLAEGLLELDLPVQAAPVPEALGSILCVGTTDTGRHDATGDARMARLYEELRKAGVTISIRRNTLRFSFHLYNNEDDVQEVIRITKEWMRIHQ